jgi:hypothetical protein
MVRPRDVLIHLPEDCRGVVEHLGLGERSGGIGEICSVEVDEK